MRRIGGPSFDGRLGVVFGECAGVPHCEVEPAGLGGLLADQGVRIFLNKHFFFSLEYDLRLNTQPAPGREKVDEAFIFAIGYQLQ